MAATTMSNLFFIFLIEYISFNAKIKKYFLSKLNFKNNAYSSLAENESDDHIEKDIDVINEQISIENNEKKYNSSIEIRGLTKIFKSTKNNNKMKIAVNNLFYSVGQSEIFGFLGSNGAGKTTVNFLIYFA